MITLTLELQPEVYRRLHEEADRLRKPPQLVAQEWLVEQLTRSTLTPGDDRQKVRQVLRAASLLTEVGPDLRKCANPTVQMEDVEAALGRTGATLLSEIVLKQRGTKG
jgi:hypothetical protein